ncbi:NAA25 family protein [Megaselia abdita]
MDSNFERRLRLIYDALDSNSNKKALSEADKVLKKHPKFLAAKALKALAILRLGREEESNVLLDAIMKEKPVDDGTLQVLTFCFKEMEQLNKICEMYNYAAKQTPGNEEILAHLFMAYVNIDDFKAQQTVALQLYKLHPKNPYYFWAVVSVFLQGVKGSESIVPEKRKLFLSLAEKMVHKIITENKIEAEQEAQLYIRILSEQAKYREALEFLDSSIALKHFPGAPTSIRIDLLRNLKEWKTLQELLEKLLKEDRDRWDYYQEYLNCSIELSKSSDNEYSSTIIEETHKSLCELINSGKPVRGPYLARLELYRLMRELKLDANKILGNCNKLLIEYFNLFGDKFCCTNDISMYIDSMQQDERSNLANILIKESAINSTNLPKTKEEMQKHITALQLARICGAHKLLESDHLLALFTTLKLHYEHGLSNFGKDLLATDMGPSDLYALLAANVMYDLSIKEQQSKPLLEALALLSYVLKNSPSNFHVKLFALKIYQLLGCLTGAQEMYDLLDIKNIQLDSMGYIHCNYLPLSGRFNFGKPTYEAALKFFTNSYKDRLAYITMSYRFGTFSKLLEFMDFRDKLTNSIHYSILSAESLILEIVGLNGTINQNLNSFKLLGINPQEDRTAWNELSDNRDLSLLVRWDPIKEYDAKSDEKESLSHEIEVLQIRLNLLRLVASIVDLMNSSTSDTETLDMLLESFIGLYQRIKLMNYKPISNKFLVNLLPSRLFLLLDLPYEQFFTDLSNFILKLWNGLVSQEDKDNINKNVDNCVNVLNSVIDENNSKQDNMWCRKFVQERISAIVEIMSLYAFVLQVSHERYLVISQLNTSKKGKRKDQLENEKSNVLNDRERLAIVIDLMRHLKNCLQISFNNIGNLKAPFIPVDLSDLMNDLSIKSDIQSTVYGDITGHFKENHVQLVNEIRCLIKDKIKLVNK